MKSILPLAVLAVALTFSGGAPLAGDGDKAEKAAAAESKRVCKRVRVTGSRIRERICRTQRDWDRISEESQETLAKQREGVNQNTSSPDS